MLNITLMNMNMYQMMFEGLHGGMNNRGRGLRYTMCKVLEGLRKVDRK